VSRTTLKRQGEKKRKEKIEGGFLQIEESIEENNE
jgi:hypothetical protein